MIRSLILILLVISSCFAVSQAKPLTANDTSAAVVPIVKIGGYQFSPYVSQSSDNRYTGLTLDLIQALNQLQSEVRFEFVTTSIENRYKAYQMQRFDMMLFESPTWGWQNIKHDFIPLNMLDGECFIALKTPNMTQEYFSDFNNKTLSLVSGYHYNFAGLNSDKSYLKSNFNVQFVNSNEASIVSVLKGRANIAPVTWSYLQFYFNRYPDIKDKLLISEAWDQYYNHGILLSPNAPISKQQLANWVAQLKQQDILTRLSANYGLISQ